MIASQSKAFFNTFHQLSYHLLSAQDVSIWNHQYIQKHNTTVARIPRHQFIAFLIVSNNLEFGWSSVCMVFMSSIWQSPHRLLQFSWANRKPELMNSHAMMNQIYKISLFIVFFGYIVDYKLACCSSFLYITNITCFCNCFTLSLISSW
jgi:hypothetical protein